MKNSQVSVGAFAGRTGTIAAYGEQVCLSHPATRVGWCVTHQIEALGFFTPDFSRSLLGARKRQGQHCGPKCYGIVTGTYNIGSFFLRSKELMNGIAASGLSSRRG